MQDRVAAVLWTDRRKRLLLAAFLTLLALFAVVATLIATVESHNDANVPPPGDATARENSVAGHEMIAPPISPTSAPPASLGGEVSSSPSSSSSGGADKDDKNATTRAPTTTAAPNIVTQCSAADPTSVCYLPPASSSYCMLDKSMDPNVMYVANPSIANANGGFAMDQACASGSRCTYGCEPPFVPSSNGWSNADCIPYLALCPPYSPATATGGILCDNGRVIADDPTQHLCVPGLNTSFVTNYVPATLSTCLAVTPGSGSPMVGVEIAQNQTKQLTSYPQWFWRGVSAQMYVNLPGVRRIAACQRNADPLSLNAQGLDTMPFVVGGGSLPGSGCAACGQHTLAFNDGFDFRKAYSKVPGYGIRVRNCNDQSCGPVQCDATYVYNPTTLTLDAYWVKYNTVFDSTSVGCVADVVTGYGWTPADGVSKFTLYEYYPTTASGQQTASCPGCSAPSAFDPGYCKKLRQAAPARFGSGVVPAQFICTAVGAAVGRAATLSTFSSNDGGNDATTTTIYIEAGIASFLLLVVIGLVWRARKLKPQTSSRVEEPTDSMDMTPDRRQSMHPKATYVPRSSTTFDAEDVIVEE
ncbi:unnamed protein product [Aphanomyces euteiches]|uniref:Uncharacterized protein n=1 Tax=Aphanomyces euteiches TaxID=100861 RepID=A0A6G0XNI1_9STRA|nr:hypothetical protein Ae201684_002937 [Aphanomyces euteiches]KAH9093236.1 hypothetical protein Ae201684P_008895 [Aphanomyces euteiches]KAH9155740.1 hypothetical protein AeRB84_002306 [Aphanomyces euteiches]